MRALLDALGYAVHVIAGLMLVGLVFGIVVVAWTGWLLAADRRKDRRQRATAIVSHNESRRRRAADEERYWNERRATPCELCGVQLGRHDIDTAGNLIAWPERPISVVCKRVLPDGQWEEIHK